MKPIALCIHLVFVSTCCAQFSFTRIVDTSTAIPNGTGNFQGFSSTDVPTISQGSVLFNGFGSAQQQGIYSFPVTSGTGIRIADRTSVIPGSSSTTFNSLQNPVVKNGTVTLMGFTANSAGIFAYPASGGAGTVIADRNTLIPGTTEAIFSLVTDSTSFDGNRVVFRATTQSGLINVLSFLPNGTGGVRVAGNTTPIPSGTGNFNSVFGSFTDITANTVAFRGSSGSQAGVYTFPATGGSGTRIIDLNSSIPGGIGNFTNIGFPEAIENGRVFVTGNGSAGQTGIFSYTTTGTDGIPLVTNATPVPGGTGNFSLFLSLVAEDNAIIFRGNDANNQGVLALMQADGTGLTRIIGVGDALDGRIVSGLGTPTLRSGSLEDNTFVFGASFTDGTSGIYAVAVPEPTTLGLAGLAMLVGSVVLFKRKHRRRRFQLKGRGACDGSSMRQSSVARR